MWVMSATMRRRLGAVNLGDGRDDGDADEIQRR
jgi:hypothetical protein